MAAGIAMAVLITEVTKPRRSDVLKAVMMVWFWTSRVYHRKLKPSMGKLANSKGLNERMMTTTMGANMVI
jgi:hypothetical protein